LINQAAFAWIAIIKIALWFQHAAAKAADLILKLKPSKMAL